MIRICTILILILFSICCSTKTDKQIADPCILTGLPSVASIDQMTLLMDGVWEYAYSFNQDSCFILDNPHIPVSYSFSECDPNVFKSRLPVPFSSLPLSQYCFRIVEKQGATQDSMYYTILHIVNKKIDVAYFGEHMKNIFFINKISRDTLVVEFTNVFESPNGIKIKTPRQVFLRKKISS